MGAGILSLGISLVGCGDSGSGNTIAISPPQGNTPVVADVPQLEAPLQSDEDQDFVEAFFDAQVGGKLVLPNGAELEIPAGALSSSQTIRFAYRPDDVPAGGPPTLDDYGEDPQKDGDVYYEVTPSQTLAKPATIRIPYPLEPEWERPTLYSASVENPLVDYGSEQSRYEIEEPNYDDVLDIVTYETDHFSAFDMFTSGEPAYVVMDVPSKYLRPTDILMTLTKQNGTTFKSIGMGPGPGWTPGHVGIYTGTNAPFPQGTTIDTGGSRPSTVGGTPDSVEAVPDAVHATNVDFFRTGFHNDHLYLGPRRARSEVTREQQSFIVGQAPRALRKPYALFGDSNAVLGSFFNLEELRQRLIDPFSTDRGYSCVGLVDVLYVFAGKPLVGNLSQNFIAVTPKDMMEATDPVRSATLRIGEPFEMKFYGVIRKPEYGTTKARIPYIRDRRASDGGVNCEYDIDFENRPPGSTINEDGQGYTFRWNPNQRGTFRMTVRMRAEVNIKNSVLNPFSSKFDRERKRDQPINESFEFTVE